VTQRIVVLGTGTGVGKTYFSTRLVESLVRSGYDTLALKPIESGVTPGASDSDAARLAAASGRPAGHCYALPDPISPHLAARRAGVSLDLDRVASWVREHEAASVRAPDFVLIESAGGAFSPLGDAITNFDLAKRLDPALWLLVAPDSLGVLHEVRSCLLALEALGRRPDHVALCQARALDESSGTNAAELERLGITRVAAQLLRDADASSELCAFLTNR
jgi:dethiobiotin synthetase